MLAEPCISALSDTVISPKDCPLLDIPSRPKTVPCPKPPETALISRLVPDQNYEEFLCSICCDLLQNPRQCLNGHACCYSCLFAALSEHQCCPVCRVRLHLETAGRNLHLERSLSTLQFRCANDGCDGTFPMAEQENHATLCRYRLVQCACQTKVPLESLYSHLQQCGVWLVMTNRSADIDTHTASESDAPMVCQTTSELQCTAEIRPTSALSIEELQTVIQDLRVELTRVKAAKQRADNDNDELHQVMKDQLARLQSAESLLESVLQEKMQLCRELEQERLRAQGYQQRLLKTKDALQRHEVEVKVLRDSEAELAQLLANEQYAVARLRHRESTCNPCACM